jgi:DMSO/TMAO reductase YedYZ heme-binding membrane subunit
MKKIEGVIMSEFKLSNSRDYLVAALIGAVLTVFLGVYLLLRRGYVFAAPASAGALYVPNKVLAGVAVVLIGLSFLVGPLTRYFNRFDSWLNYRKEIGIVGGLFGILHGLVSAFLIPKKFTLEGLFSSYSFGTTIAGLIAMIVFVALITISYQAMIKWIGGVRWWLSVLSPKMGY